MLHFNNVCYIKEIVLSYLSVITVCYVIPSNYVNAIATLSYKHNYVSLG